MIVWAAQLTVLPCMCSNGPGLSGDHFYIPPHKTSAALGSGLSYVLPTSYLDRHTSVSVVRMQCWLRVLWVTGTALSWLDAVVKVCQAGQ